MKSSLVSLEQVTKTYDKEKTVVNQVSFNIYEGECFALLGHNGAGKSTLIKMMTGIFPVSSGTIAIRDEIVTPFNKKAQELFSYLPETMSFYPHLTAWETLTFFARITHSSEKECEELLELVGLVDFRHEKLRTYSKGMTQRLGWAIAMLGEKPLLILDEPTSGLDPFWAIRFQQIVKEWNKKGVTILLASHILPEVEELADRVGIMSHGSMVAVGTLDELRKKLASKVKIRIRWESDDIPISQLAEKWGVELLKEKNSLVAYCKPEEKWDFLQRLEWNGRKPTGLEIQDIGLQDLYKEVLGIEG